MGTMRLFIIFMLVSVRRQLVELPSTHRNTAGRFWMVATSSGEVTSSEVCKGHVWSFSTGDGDFTQQIEEASSPIVLPF